MPPPQGFSQASFSSSNRTLLVGASREAQSEPDGPAPMMAMSCMVIVGLSWLTPTIPGTQKIVSKTGMNRRRYGVARPTPQAKKCPLDRRAFSEANNEKVTAEPSFGDLIGSTVER